MSVDDDDEVPPLEDFGPVLAKRPTVQAPSQAVPIPIHVAPAPAATGVGAAAAPAPIPAPAPTPTPTLASGASVTGTSGGGGGGAAAAAAPAASAKKSSETGFAGLRKGFLLGPAPKPAAGATAGHGTTPTPTSTATAAAAPAIVDVRPTEAPKPKGLLPELQQQQRTASADVAAVRGLLQPERQKEWLTPDLLSRVASDPGLLAAMSNPRMLEAIEAFSRDPQGAMRKYAGDAEVMRFLTTFGKLMGEHFNKLAEKQQQQQQQKQPPSKP